MTCSDDQARHLACSCLREERAMAQSFNVSEPLRATTLTGFGQTVTTESSMKSRPFPTSLQRDHSAS